jgi:hypothetical protein
MIPVEKALEAITEKPIFFELVRESLAHAASTNDQSITAANSAFDAMDHKSPLRVSPSGESEDVQYQA